jgi:alginate O-acetyltransferase complex protein AlgI
VSFVSLSFLLLFSVVFALRLSPIGRYSNGRAFVGSLLLSSLVFYGWHVPAYLLLLLASTTTDFFVGRRLHTATSDRHRKALLLVSVAVNLGLLGFFKYANFLVGALGDTLGWVGAAPDLPHLDLVLPIGISFYTFQTLSYTIDIYRRRLEPIDDFARFFLYVSFFPQLVAGPIVRASEFLPQFARRRRLRLVAFNHGCFLIIRGYFLKVVCADNLAQFVDARWERAIEPGAPGDAALIAALLFSAQIFYDFAGYSSIARGLACLLGYRLPVNFDNPYIAGSFKNFWERWHISLSRWLRDYLYVSLGGNRVSRLRTYVNLMLVMLLGGLWHGAAYHYVAWGALHGIALAVERRLGLQAEGRSGWVRASWFVVVQVVVLIAWILFRSATLGDAGIMLGNIAHASGWGGVGFVELAALVWVVPLLLMHLRGDLTRRGKLRPPGQTELAFWAAAMAVGVCTLYGPGTEFIYFQF